MKTITFDETKWKLVPVQPTREMLMAALDADNASYDNHQYVLTEQWNAMLAATPATPLQEPGKCAQCHKPYRKGADTKGCPKCAPGVDVPESEFQKPILASSQVPVPLTDE